MTVRSIQPRRQRKAMFTAHIFERRRRMAVPLSRELRQRYGRRSVVVRKGDTVRILTGSYIGREERVARVNRRSYSVTLDNITGKTGEAKLKPLPIRTGHLLLTRLNLSDPWRRRVLRVPEAEVPTETDAEAPARPEPEALETPTETPEETKAEKPEKPARKRSRAKPKPSADKPEASE